MKKLMLSIVLLSTTFLSCKKEEKEDKLEGGCVRIFKIEGGAVLFTNPRLNRIDTAYFEESIIKEYRLKDGGQMCESPFFALAKHMKFR
jgi:hypothetical protein